MHPDESDLPGWGSVPLPGRPPPGRVPTGVRPAPVRRRASARPGPGQQPRRSLDLDAVAGVLDVRVAAGVLGVLAALGLLGATVSFAVDLFVAPWRIFTTDVEESIHLLASIVALVGAFRLHRAVRRGRTLVLVSLALNVAATIVFSGSTLTRVETLVPVLVWLALAAAMPFLRWPSPAPPTPAPPAQPWPPPFLRSPGP